MRDLPEDIDAAPFVQVLHGVTGHHAHPALKHQHTLPEKRVTRVGCFVRMFQQKNEVLLPGAPLIDRTTPPEMIERVIRSYQSEQAERIAVPPAQFV